MRIPAKIHAVTFRGSTQLVEAQTKQGAIRDAIAAYAQQLQAEADCAVATGEQLYEAGRLGTPIINHGKYKAAVDPVQAPMPFAEQEP